MGLRLIYWPGCICIRVLTIIPYFRSWELEKQGKQLSNYRDMYQSLSKWIGDTKQKLDVLETAKLTDAHAVARSINEQKVGKM